MFKIYVSVLFLMVVTAPYIYSGKLEQNLSEWHNKVESAEFDIQDDGSCLITLHCQEKPICLYLPDTFGESLDRHKKRYVLPRTQWSDESMSDFMYDFQAQVSPIGLHFSSYKIPGRNFGTGILFEIDSSQYTIEKKVDNDNKSIHFMIKIK